MGCDIHAVWQVKMDGREYWRDVPEGDWDQGRDYFLFAWLADVRNGQGFAGCKIFEPVTPISEPRGLPKGFEMNKESEHWGKWMGDHSHTWLTADEILNTAPPVVKQFGVIDATAYVTWKEGTEPDEYCGDIIGNDIKVADSVEEFRRNSKDYTHVRVEWSSGHDRLKYFIDEVRRMREKHGPTLRLVMGFDS